MAGKRVVAPVSGNQNQKKNIPTAIKSMLIRANYPKTENFGFRKLQQEDLQQNKPDGKENSRLSHFDSPDSCHRVGNAADGKTPKSDFTEKAIPAVIIKSPTKYIVKRTRKLE